MRGAVFRDIPRNVGACSTAADVIKHNFTCTEHSEVRFIGYDYMSSRCLVWVHSLCAIPKTAILKDRRQRRRQVATGGGALMLTLNLTLTLSNRVLE